MDINKEILTVTDKVITEKLPEMLEKSVTSMLEGIVKDLFSSYSATAKAVKQKIEEKLDVNLQEFDLLDYNAMVAKVVNDALLQQVNLQPILELTRNAVGFVEKKTIKLSEIVEMFKDAAMEESSDESYGEISLHIEPNESSKYISVSIDTEKGKERHQCGISFTYSTDRGTIFIFKTKDHWRIQDKLTASRLTSLSNLEHKIFRLYSAQVKIETDDLSYETEWYREY